MAWCVEYGSAYGGFRWIKLVKSSYIPQTSFHSINTLCFIDSQFGVYSRIYWRTTDLNHSNAHLSFYSFLNLKDKMKSVAKY